MDELSGPGLYRRNLFRLSGLSTDATSADIRRRRWAAEDDSEIMRALDELNDPMRRVVDELFWLWDTPGAGCDCPHTLHRDHDLAVRAHARALGVIIPMVPEAPEPKVKPNDPCACESGLKYKQCHGAASSPAPSKNAWLEAAEAWSALLRRAAFWDHVRSRIRALDDRRLDESAIGTLRSGLPRALVAPQLKLAAHADDPKSSVRFLDSWDLGGTVVADLLDEVTAPLYSRIEENMGAAVRELDNGDPHAAGVLLTGVVTESLTRLESLHPHERHRRAATVRDQVAILLNNTAMASANAGHLTWQVNALFAAAAKLALTDRTRAAIQTNRDELAQLDKLNAELKPFGLTATDDWPTVLTERFTGLVRAERYPEALRLLTFLHDRVKDPIEAAQMDSLRQALAMAMLTGQRLTIQTPRRRPDPERERFERRRARTDQRNARVRARAEHPVIRGGPVDGASTNDLYRLSRQILDPVRERGVVFGTGAVREWADRVKLLGDEKHIYLLLQVWWLVTRDPAEKGQIYLYICAIWERTNKGQRPLRGVRWALAILAGAAVVCLVWIYSGVLWALLALAVVVTVEIAAALVVLRRGVRKIAQYFPDFVGELLAGIRQ